ncbi:glycosyltransferase family protein [Rhodococcus chondri]|uniref:Glycosyltransferase family 1 protein n=1 Tax=Rhodococcus chondri TaxID=3065941 RepID=A0ABU7JT56_9NOCA|nr:glycosyltransferase family 1 protein [Rhodococcus sp. CC-R104]MEE2032947.1 glycosyltransferase family 1 protein [Rhodococcus sp. CC-R104]
MIRVASVPASHVYVRHLASPGGDDGVIRLPDPIPADGRKVPGGWWPPLMLEPNWITEHHTEFDVFHIHFGFDAIGPEQLQDIVAELDDHGIPLVYTVHDLRNPHHRDPGAHAKQLDVLIPAARELITLTPGAAARIRSQWGRQATVLPHPHVVEREWCERPRRSGGPFTVGVHAKSLRANMDLFPVLDTLTETVRTLPDAILRIDVHDEIFDADNPYWHNPEAGKRILEYGKHSHVDVRVHPYFSDDELWQYLADLSVSVLPYRFGTHSGWLEACIDLGTAVVAPSCGFYGEQRPCGVYTLDETRFDPRSLDRAVRTLYETRQFPRASWPERMCERRELARAHRAVYERALQETGS